ncbi:polysaccharide deacetylase family protein [Mucilaginibacter sp. UR6-11]|uniref:polysaccharide deacetylase family protein n=1 Tax=Mucilaginibacter sp. UR6-11 TaxID=1435644 RepID=UPI001E2D4566|nr:polysaccharide deacetylase family protein [Mucilaginibacter sp. UR6-11]MCC8424869.1 polysaccharide deacetylase family protein [Mucilaginibacter sp. UR6-11]
MEKGKFVISLDFELHWGGVEIWDLKEKKDYFTNARIGIPKMLSLFNQYQIHCTWATVGFLFAKNIDQLRKIMPDNRPTYSNNALNYYSIIDQNEIGFSEAEDPFHYAVSLIDLILKTPYQELASHTFCHYYCNEKGQNIEQFEADTAAAQKIAMENFGVELKSLVFPRNQFNKEYLEAAKKNGFKVFRSNPNVWFWQKNHGRLSPIFRAIDTLFYISRPLSFSHQEVVFENGIIQLPASRFFRPFMYKEKSIRKIKLKRILDEMTYAAKNNNIYHLWWHPHNFGNAVKENMEDLEVILVHYRDLNSKFGFESKSMGSFSRR